MQTEKEFTEAQAAYARRARYLSEKLALCIKASEVASALAESLMDEIEDEEVLNMLAESMDATERDAILRGEDWAFPDESLDYHEIQIRLARRWTEIKEDPYEDEDEDE